MLLPCAYYMDCRVADQVNRAEAVNALDVVEGMHAFLFLASHDPLSNERSFITIRVPKSDAQTQFALWKTS